MTVGRVARGEKRTLAKGKPVARARGVKRNGKNRPDRTDRTDRTNGRMSEEEAELLIRTSPVYWFATCAHILDKDRVDRRPVPNILQVRMSAAHEWQRAHGLQSRQIVVKIRQVGGTTFAVAIIYHACQGKSKRAVMIADCLAHSDNQFGMLKYYGETDDFDWGTTFAANTLEAEWSNGSRAEKKTAEKPASTRSSTIQALQTSEVAYWPATRAKDAAATMTSLGNSLQGPDTVSIEESTPHGAYGVFAEDWRDARWPEFDRYWAEIYGCSNESGPGNGKMRVFAAWYELEENEKSDAMEIAALEAVAVCEEERADEEKDKLYIARMLARQGVPAEEVAAITRRKIAWRRWCVRDAERCRGDWSVFREEYPSDPVSCWVHSGKPRFNAEGVARLQKMAEARKPMYGILDSQNDGSVVFRQTSANEAWLWVWEEPRPGCYYGMTIDPMTGADQTAGKDDPDENAVGVLRRGYVDAGNVQWNTMLAARIAPGNQMDATPLMVLGARLAKWYGDCMTVVEVNKGLHVLERCKDHKLNLYRRTVKIDALRDEVVERLGWETDAQNREEIIEPLADLIRRGAIDVYCPAAARQLSTFVRNRSGKAEGAPGCHDDDVIMLGLGVKTQASWTRYKEPARRAVHRPRGDYW